MDLAAAWADARVFEIVKTKWDSLPPPPDKKDQKKGGAKKGGGAKRPGSSSPAKVGSNVTDTAPALNNHTPSWLLTHFFLSVMFISHTQTHKHTPSCTHYTATHIVIHTSS